MKKKIGNTEACNNKHREISKFHLAHSVELEAGVQNDDSRKRIFAI